MGNFFSRRKGKGKDELGVQDMATLITSNVGSLDSNPNAKLQEFRQLIRTVELENLEKMRDDLKKNPMAFILNNLVLSIQFLDNFERDKEVIQKKKIEQEQEVSKALNNARKKCIYHGALVEVVGQRHRYKSKESNYPEVYPNMKHVIVHENFEVYPEEMYPSLASKVYTTVDERIYRVCMEDLTAENLPGFVRLLAVDFPIKKVHDGSCSGSTMYDKVDGESTDGYSKLSDYEHSKRSSLHNSSSSTNSEPSTKEEQQTEVSKEVSCIATRPPMKTPDPSDSDSEENMEDFKQKVRDRSLEDTNPGIRKPIVSSIFSVPLDEASEESDSNSNAGGRRGSGIVGPKSMADFLNQRKIIEKITKADHCGQDNGHSNAIKASHSMPELNNRSSSSDEEYDYSSLNGPKKLKPPKKGRNHSLPSDCFKNLKKRVKDDSDPLGIADQFEYRTYLSSQAFFDHFSQTFCEWGERLNLKDLQGAMEFKSGVYYSETRDAPHPPHRVTKEFIPALRVHEWPAIANEWRDRPRKPLVDPRTNIAYTWPHPEKVKAITKMGCHLLTDGGKVKGRFSLQKNFEWQLAFGNAEESLLSTLSHSHMRCLLWAQLIFCHVLEPLKILGPHHVTTLFLWMVERNYVDFEEVFLGERVALMFKKLYSRLKQRKLPHYFIRSRNLLSSKRSDEILKAQERVYRLLERFVPITIQAALQIESSNSHYPFPNLDELWDILTTKEVLASINPDLIKEAQLSAAVTNHGEPDVKLKKKPSSNDQTRQLLKKKRARRMAEEREKAGGPKQSAEEDKFKLPIGALNEARTKLLLSFFIKHFIAMARAANKNRAFEMSIVFLSQASNLNVLLGDLGYCDEVNENSKTIEELRYIPMPSHFNEAVVNIPGTPYVFETGVRPRTISESNYLENRPRAEIPLPREPEGKKSPISNGHVPRSNEAAKKPIHNPPNTSLNSVWPKGNHIQMQQVTVTIEQPHIDLPDSDSDSRDSLQLPRRPSRVFLPHDSEDESTDF